MIKTRFTITANGQFGCGFCQMSRSLQYQTVQPADAPRSSFAAQAFFCQMLQKIIIPLTIHIALLTAVIVEVGRAENSFSTVCHARAVHSRKAFHAVRNNTSHSSRVTRKGSLLIVDLLDILMEAKSRRDAMIIMTKCASFDNPEGMTEPCHSFGVRNNRDPSL